MLVHLSIHNYAIVEHLDLELARGMSVITGETGAGKSIMLDALGLASRRHRRGTPWGDKATSSPHSTRTRFLKPVPGWPSATRTTPVPASCAGSSLPKDAAAAISMAPLPLGRSQGPRRTAHRYS